MDDNAARRQNYALRFQLRSGEVYDRAAKVLRRDLFPAVELEARLINIVTPEQLLASAESAWNAIPDTQGSEVVKKMLRDILEEWLTGMTMYRLGMAEGAPMWMLVSAICSAARASEDIEQLEDILLADLEDLTGMDDTED